MSSKWKIVRKRLTESFYRFDAVSENCTDVNIADTVTVLTKADRLQLLDEIQSYRQAVTFEDVMQATLRIIAILNPE